MKVSKIQIGLWASLIALAGLSDIARGADGWDYIVGITYLVNAVVMVVLASLDSGDSPPPAL